MHQSTGEPGDKAVHGDGGEAAKDARVEPGSGVLRHAVYPSQREHGGVLRGRGKRQVGIQSREQGAVGADRFPSQPQPGTAFGFLQISGPHPHQPGHPGRESCRSHQAIYPRAIGVLGGAQQHAVAGKALQLARGGIKADVHQDVVADEHIAAHVTSPPIWMPGWAGAGGHARRAGGPATQAAIRALSSLAPMVATSIWWLWAAMGGAGWAKVPRQRTIGPCTSTAFRGEMATWATSAFLAPGGAMDAVPPPDGEP